MPRFVIKGFTWTPELPFELDYEVRYRVVRRLAGETSRLAIPENGFPYEFESDVDFGIEVDLPGHELIRVRLRNRTSERPSIPYPAVDAFGPMLERTYSVEYRKTGYARQLRPLLVYYKFEDDRAGLTPPPVLRDRIVRVESEEKRAPFTLSGSGLGSSVAKSTNRLDEAEPYRYLVMPGNYSGDSWAVAFALLLDDRIKVALPTKPDEMEGIFRRTTLQFNDLCAGLGIGDFERRVLISADLTGQQVSEGAVANAADKIIRKDIGELRQAEGSTFCGWTFASSSVILHAAERRGLGVVLGEIRRAVTHGVTLATYLARELERIASVDECVLINMRIGRRGNHPQHDMNLVLYTQIVEAVTAAGYRPVRVGTYQNSEFTPGGQWMRDLTAPVVEIFPPGEAANRQQIATFWHRVAALPNVLGVIGGRSGSLDIAALMGVRTLCWDIVDPHDQEYIRQLLYAPFMSICPRSGGELTTAIKNKTEPMPGHLSPAALALWLAGHAVVPRRKVDPDGGFLTTLKLALLRDAEARKRLYLRTVDFMRVFTGDGGGQEDVEVEEDVEALPTGRYDEIHDRVRSSTGQVYAVGRAPGGGNCFYHCIAQRVNDGRDHARLRLDLSQSVHVAVPQRVRVGTDGEDATDGDIQAMSALLDRPIVIHTVAYGESVTQEQTVGSHATGVALHILHRYDPIDGRGHYDPMAPAG